jgi:hypothetical protein
MFLACNDSNPPLAFMLDFLYTREGDTATLSLTHLEISAETMTSTAPRIYGCFGRQLSLALELGARIQSGLASDEEKEAFAFMAGMWPRDILDVPRAMRSSSFVMRDIHYNDRDERGNLHVGDRVDAILLPWVGDAEFKATNQSVV